MVARAGLVHACMAARKKRVTGHRCAAAQLARSPKPAGAQAAAPRASTADLQCIREKMDVIDLEDESIDAGGQKQSTVLVWWSCAVQALWLCRR